MDTDLTFITNEGKQNLKQRFEELINNARFFDCLVGYFYASGFYAVYKSLEKSQKIRVLVGISTDRQTYENIKLAETPEQESFYFSSAETKEKLEPMIMNEMEEAADDDKTENGIAKFIEWVRDGKLEIRAFPSGNIHAKVYIMTFAQGHYDKGRVITGSSNFTRSGLVDNLEFNVELKDRADYEFAKKKFEELWKTSVNVSQKYVDTIKNKTWLNDSITPYELYLKFLYEYFKDDLNQYDEMVLRYLPAEFKKLEYQEQAVLNAKKILESYGGVFISDVVGLGKTYISAMLAAELGGRNLIIAPPALIDEKNPGSWCNVFNDFNVSGAFRSIGKLDQLIKEDLSKYDNVFIDEAHRFRTENNITYEKLAEICRGKRVILVTATPYNNSPKDILSQIKLFQNARKSNIPNMPDLERFFAAQIASLKKLDRQRDYVEYIKTVKGNAKEIREKVLKYLMVRRTRSEIAKYFAEDLAKQNLKFPEVEKPVPVFYRLSEKEDLIFSSTLELLIRNFTYARYKPLIYYKGDVSQPEELAQQNMGKFMKILLVKRLESSYHAFKNSINRFLHSYEKFLAEYDNGDVYISKKYTNKIFEFLEEGNGDAVEQLITEGKAEKFPSKDFTEDFKKALQNDRDILRKIKAMWSEITQDPKLGAFLQALKTEEVLKKNKLIIFTESKETAEYLAKHIESVYPGKVLCYTGGSSEYVREEVIENFDAKSRFPKDQYRILVCTEVLAEGVNLHQANVVINYDLPWNPTRMMQRVGRINRVDTKFDKIYTYNFFPTKQANNAIKLKEAAESKINAFISLLGSDAKLLTDGEPIEQHELFSRLTSKKTLTGEDEGEESELKYLQFIKGIRDKNKKLFERIKHLPKKARTAREDKNLENALLTYFRHDKLQKFFIGKPKEDSKELDFIAAAKRLEAKESVPRKSWSKEFFQLLEKNKRAFAFSTTANDLPETKTRGGRDSATQVLRVLKMVMKDRSQLTEDQEIYLNKVMLQLEEGGLPKQTTKVVSQALDKEIQKGIHPLRIMAVLQLNVPSRLLESHFSESVTLDGGRREVILSEYFTK